MTASEHLRRATEGIHRRLECTPFARAIRSGRLEAQTYIDYLGALAIIVYTLRTQIHRHGSETQQEALADLDQWSERLAADLDRGAERARTA